VIKKQQHGGGTAAIIWTTWNGLPSDDPGQRGGLGYIDG
jgi:hypothetical protein